MDFEGDGMVNQIDYAHLNVRFLMFSSYCTSDLILCHVSTYQAPHWAIDSVSIPIDWQMHNAEYKCISVVNEDLMADRDVVPNSPTSAAMDRKSRAVPIWSAIWMIDQLTIQPGVCKFNPVANFSCNLLRQFSSVSLSVDWSNSWHSVSYRWSCCSILLPVISYDPDVVSLLFCVCRLHFKQNL